MLKEQIHGLTLELLTGDIAKQADMDAVVNAANAQLRPGGGVAGALHRAAGPSLEEEGRRHAPLSPGQAVVTQAYGLPNRWVIHCLGPVYGQDEPADELLASCYREALRLAEEKGLGTVAFPSISTGAFGYPAEDAARVAITTLAEQAPRLNHVHQVRFVLYDQDSFRTFAQVLGQLRDRNDRWSGKD